MSTTSSRLPGPLLDGLARILLGLVFVNALLGKFGGFAATASMMAERGLPLARVLLVLAMLLMGVGSILLISGVRARLGAVLLMVFLVPTTLIFHTALDDPSQRIAFFKNLSILGGLLLVASREEPRAGRT